MQTLTKKPMKLPPRNAMVQLTDPDTGKARKMRALGQAARRIYRKQILAGTDPAFVLPRELRWQDGLGGGRIFARPAAEIQKRQAYKSYLSSHQLHNTEKLPKFAGFDMLFDFRSVLESVLLDDRHYQGGERHCNSFSVSHQHVLVSLGSISRVHYFISLVFIISAGIWNLDSPFSSNALPTRFQASFFNQPAPPRLHPSLSNSDGQKRPGCFPDLNKALAGRILIVLPCGSVHRHASPGGW